MLQIVADWIQQQHQILPTRLHLAFVKHVCAIRAPLPAREREMNSFFDFHSMLAGSKTWRRMMFQAS